MTTPINAPGASRAGTRTELALPGLLLGGGIVLAAFALLATILDRLAADSTPANNGYAAWVERVPYEFGARLQWVLGDMTEPQFYKSPLASAGLLLGAAIAWWAGKRGLRWAGTSIAYGSGLWPWMLGAATLSLVLSNLAFGWRMDSGWQPTFVPFVCVATAVVLVYGSGWGVLLTGAVLGAATTTPVAMLLISTVTGPMDLPPVVANTASMAIGTVISFLLIRALPWMRLPTSTEDAAGSAQARTIAGTPSIAKDTKWVIRRVITDFTETQFWANELASLGLLAGLLISALINPGFASYGSGLLPQILFAQALTSTIGVIVWRHLYRGGGWAPTYISLVSVAPACVLVFEGSVLSIVAGATAGAILCPMIARPISARLPGDMHPFVGNVISMAVATSLIVTVLRWIPGV